MFLVGLMDYCIRLKIVQIFLHWKHTLSVIYLHVGPSIHYYMWDVMITQPPRPHTHTHTQKQATVQRSNAVSLHVSCESPFLVKMTHVSFTDHQSIKETLKHLLANHKPGFSTHNQIQSNTYLRMTIVKKMNRIV